jgi:hypothetical protein
MPLRRRDRQTPDPPKEREMPIRIGRQLPDLAREREMHEMRARLDAMEIAQRRTVNAGDINESESENEARNKEVAAEYATDECLFRAVARIGAREKMDISVYEGNMDVEELLDWIRALDKYFDYEDV